MKKRIKLSIIISSSVILFIILASIIYMIPYYKAKDVDKYIISGEIVKIEENKDYYFFDGPGVEECLIFYPGARVEAKSYSKMCNDLAKSGIDCYIVRMPLHFAIFNSNYADELIDETNYLKYHLAGHSLGGAMISRYAYKNVDKIDSLILVASYTDKIISDSLPILSIYGSNDKVLNINKAKANLNECSKVVEINGGNHANFASYGKQKGDGVSTISSDEQIDILVNEIINFLKNNG